MMKLTSAYSFFFMYISLPLNIELHCHHITINYLRIIHQVYKPALQGHNYGFPKIKYASTHFSGIQTDTLLPLADCIQDLHLSRKRRLLSLCHHIFKVFLWRYVLVFSQNAPRKRGRGETERIFKCLMLPLSHSSKVFFLETSHKVNRLVYIRYLM